MHFASLSASPATTRPSDSASLCSITQARRLSGEERYAPYIQLRKIKDHFIFTIESTGAWRPHELFNYAVQVGAQGGWFGCTYQHKLSWGVWLHISAHISTSWAGGLAAHISTSLAAHISTS